MSSSSKERLLTEEEIRRTNAQPRLTCFGCNKSHAAAPVKYAWKWGRGEVVICEACRNDPDKRSAFLVDDE